MTRLTPELRTAAERLLRLEASPGKRTAPEQPAAFRVIERFRLVLSTFLGAAGFRALLASAVTLAKAEAPELSAVEVQADGSLAGPITDEHGRKGRVADGEVVLVAHLLGLLLTFIGEALMLRLVSSTWPKVSFDDLDFDKGTNR